MASGAAASSRRCVVVTGASSGIGRATAEAFARCGDLVFGTSRHASTDIEEPSTADGFRLVELDVCQPDSVRRCIETIVQIAGRIDVLVNNAGIMQLAMAEEITDEQADTLLQTNLLGPARVINAVLPAMRARGSGRIVNVGSLAAWFGEPGEAHYAASKAGLARYSEALRHEVRHCGVHVSIIEPGVFATKVLDHAITSRHPIPAYDKIRTAVDRTMRRAMKHGADASRVADRIVSIADQPSPRRRYSIGPDGVWVPLAQVLMPQRWSDTLLRRSYRLDD